MIQSAGQILHVITGGAWALIGNPADAGGRMYVYKGKFVSQLKRLG